MNFKDVKAPFDLEDIKFYFENKDSAYFIVDYSQSTVRGNNLITYLSNIGIPSDLDQIDQQQASSILVDYINSPMLVEIPCLIRTLIKCLLRIKGKQCYYHSILDDQHCDQFIDHNKDLLNKLMLMILSCSLYNWYSVNDEQVKQTCEQIEKIDDRDYIGVNFAYFFYYDEVFGLFENNDTSKYKFFVKQFTENMFKNKSLYEFWHNSDNPISVLTFAIASGSFDKDAYVKSYVSPVQ